MAVWSVRGGCHGARGGPLTRSLVIPLGAGENRGVAAPGNQHFSVREQRGGMACASGGHATGGSPGIGTAEGLCSCAGDEPMTSNPANTSV